MIRTALGARLKMVISNEDAGLPSPGHHYSLLPILKKVPSRNPKLGAKCKTYKPEVEHLPKPVVAGN
jgi:hypothetical protein